MIRQRGLEFIVGIFIILGVIAFVILAFKVSGLSNTLTGTGTYTVTAAFDNIGDLKVRAPVTIAGVNIGRVTNIKLDPKTYKAVVKLKISEAEKHVPTDSTANIFTAGLLGANYISITPGFADTFLKDGGTIEDTNQALILQNLIGQIMFSLKQKK